MSHASLHPALSHREITETGSFSKDAWLKAQGISNQAWVWALRSPVATSSGRSPHRFQTERRKQGAPETSAVPNRPWLSHIITHRPIPHLIFVRNAAPTSLDFDRSRPRPAPNTSAESGPVPPVRGFGPSVQARGQEASGLGPSLGGEASGLGPGTLQVLVLRSEDEDRAARRKNQKQHVDPFAGGNRVQSFSWCVSRLYSIIQRNPSHL